MDKQKMIRTIRECASRLKRTPTHRELIKAGISARKIRTYFRNMTEALKASGLEPLGIGYRRELAAILLDWAAVTRKLGGLPSAREYARVGKYSRVPFVRLFGRWSEVPAKFVDFARQHGIERQWQDVVKAATAAPKISQGRKPKEEADHSYGGNKVNQIKLTWHAQSGGLRLQLMPNSGRPVYGAPMASVGMIHEPTNEDGVILLFGMLAAKLGLLVRRVQGEFPDCEVMCEVEAGRWISLLIEFEFESRNFARHGHRPDGCDMIVCWVHNWERCPASLQVLELSRVVKEV